MPFGLPYHVACRHEHKGSLHRDGLCIQCLEFSGKKERAFYLFEDGSRQNIFTTHPIPFPVFARCAECDTFLDEEGDYLCPKCRDS